MKILILGYGKEGKAVEQYFKNKNYEIEILDNFSEETLKSIDYTEYDMVFRSPSVRPLEKNWTSSTKYFFDNCICKIIGVTGTKGKGTTCTIISEILKNLGYHVHVVGNIGNPAIAELNSISPEDVVVYEMSSFQLWDMNVSPAISVILRIEPDHLNIHKDYNEYICSKGNIAKYQKPEDACIYFSGNEDSALLAKLSSGEKIPYPSEEDIPKKAELLNALALPGKHNQENAAAALQACATYTNMSLSSFIEKHFDSLKKALSEIKGLPHRLEFIREKDGIKYFDDNFSTTLPSLEVAVNTFKEQSTVLIMGGRDKTNNADLPEISSFLKASANLQKIILIGESGHVLYQAYPDDRFYLARNLTEAVEAAKTYAKETNSEIVVMSPAAASFDMFENVYDRGDQYKTLINSL